MMSTVLTAEGFKVTDTGINVTAEQFVRAVWRYKPEIPAMSALMTKSILELRKVINLFESEGLGHKVKIMVGGGAMSEELGDRVGVDVYASTAHTTPAS
jgi:5-methyltetrahydrofolate--homocysteine methyltransferase